MKIEFDIDRVIKKGEIQNELELERVLIADRKLRVLSKDHPQLKAVRKKLRNLIESYEARHWSAKSDVSDDKIRESDIAEHIAEKERQFIARRKELIRSRLKKLDLNQQDFGLLLGHQSKSYISELINGIRPFSLRDLIVINRLLKIDLHDLIPTVLPQSDRVKIKSSIEKLGNPKLKLSQDDLALV